MNKKTVRIAYTGPEVDSGAMDVRELAPALLAFGELIEESNRALNGENAKIKVLVKSDFKKGSFDVGFEMIRSLSAQLNLLIGSVHDVSIEQLSIFMGIAGGLSQLSGISLLDLIKWIRGRKIKNATTLENGNIRLDIENDKDQDSIEVTKKVIDLYRNILVRKQLDQVLKPLEKEGVESFEVRSADDHKKTITSISKKERDYFFVPEIPEAEPQELTSQRRAVFKIVEISFEEQLKWRLDDGESRIYATILDEEFLKGIDRREYTFAKGDTLEVLLRTRQTLTTKGSIKTEHEVLEVIKHYKKPIQIPLIPTDIKKPE